ncbi:MAG: hypothetical protein K8S56_05240 [Candidatus Cloacimonetes bacterium]|nr:hypothetical protein [Candidatus Cloacimonadota bacterium]
MTKTRGKINTKELTASYGGAKGSLRDFSIQGQNLVTLKECVARTINGIG